MKAIVRLSILLGMLGLTGTAQYVPPGRVNKVITITSGTPVQVTTNIQVIADRLLIQMLKGGSGLGYICVVAVNVTPSSKCSGSGQLGAQLAPASSTAPGGSYSDTNPTSQTPGINLSTIWVDGDTTSDQVLVSYNVR